jgi:two-component system, chemotaxis family, chemotaxis protein CheY
MPPLLLKPRENDPRSPAELGSSMVRINSIGLSAAELDHLINHLDGDGAEYEKSRRKAARLPYRKPTISMSIAQPGGGNTTVQMASRNLSKGGISLLHASYLHVGTHCVVTLKHRQRGDVQIKGTISRCRHVVKNIHEIGMRFDVAIDVLDYIVADALSNAFMNESVDPATLEGAVLLVSEQPLDEVLTRVALEGSRITLRWARSIKEAMDYLNQPTDLVLCDYDLGEQCATDLLADMMAHDLVIPMMVMSADGSTPVREAIRSAGASAFLTKPIEKPLLLRAIAEYILSESHVDANRRPLFTSLLPDSPVYAMVTDFVAETGKTAKELTTAVSDGDVPGLIRRATKLSATARAVGFAPLSSIADQAVRSVNASMCLDDSKSTIDALIHACRRVRVRPDGWQPPAPPAAQPDKTGKPAKPTAPSNASAGHH